MTVTALVRGGLTPQSWTRLTFHLAATGRGRGKAVTGHRTPKVLTRGSAVWCAASLCLAATNRLIALVSDRSQLSKTGECGRPSGGSETCRAPFGEAEIPSGIR